MVSTRSYSCSHRQTLNKRFLFFSAYFLSFIFFMFSSSPLSLPKSIEFFGFFFAFVTKKWDRKSTRDFRWLSAFVCLCEWIYAVKLTVKKSVYYLCICCAFVFFVLSDSNNNNLAQSVASSLWFLPNFRSRSLSANTPYSRGLLPFLVLVLRLHALVNN